MFEHLPYFAVFYVVGILAFGLFVRFWMRSRKMNRYEEEIRNANEKKRVDEEMAKKISKDARQHRRDMEES